MKLFLAGAETWYKQMIDCRVNHILFSYFYMRLMRQKKISEMIGMVKEEQARRERAGERKMTLFLDSGGFTFLTHTGKKPPVDSYADDLIGFVKNTSSLWDLVAELDIDEPKLEVASSEDVAGWRDRLDKATGRMGKVVKVWHPHHGKAAWTTDFCQDPRHPYLALGSDIRGQKSSLLAEAHRHGKKVHGFAETKLQTDAKYLKYDSVDSTTWLRPMKYGGFFVFQNNRLRIIDHKHKGDRRIFRSYFKANGIDMTKVINEDQPELCRASLIVWRSMAARYEAQGAHNRSNNAGNSDLVTRDDADESQQGRDDEQEVDAGSGRGPRDAAADDHGVVTVQPDPRISRDPGGTAGQANRNAQSDRRGVVERAGSSAPGVSIGELNPAACVDGVDADEAVGGSRSSGQRRGVVERSCGEGDEPAADSSSDRGGGGGESRRASSPTGSAGHEVGDVTGRDRVVRMAKKKPLLVLKDGVLDRVERVQPVVNEALHSAGPYDGVLPDDPQTWAPDGMPRCIAARNTGHGFTAAETRDVDAIGNRLGCYHCAAKTPGEKDGTRRSESRWIKDHLPPTDDLGKCTQGHNDEHGWKRCEDAECARHTTRQVLVPSCQDCSLSQGGGRNVSVYTKAAKETKRMSAEEYQAQLDRGGGMTVIDEAATITQEQVDSAIKLLEQWKAQSETGAAKSGGRQETVPEQLDVGMIEGTMEGGDSRIGTSEPQNEHAALPPLSPRLVNELAASQTSNYGVVSAMSETTKRKLALVRSLPGVVCSNCAIAGECPKYEEGAACFFGNHFGALQVRNLEDLQAIREYLVDEQKVRVMRGIMQEKLTGGGQIDPRVSQEMDRLMGHIAELESVRNAPPPSPVSFQASMQGPDGTLTMSGTGRGPGIIAKLFGAATPTMENEPARAGTPAPVEASAIDVKPGE